MPATSVAGTRVRRAVVPAAGLGTRLRPITSAIPKEMLPVGRKPVLEHVVDELRAARITEVVFVISPGKEVVRAYFGDGCNRGVRCAYVVQPEMLGLGDALLRAEPLVADEPFAVAFGDCIVQAQTPPLARLLAAQAENAWDAAVLVERVPRESTSRYGVVSPTPGADAAAAFAIRDVVEKPRPEEAPSDLAVAARWVLCPAVFDVIRRTPADANGEVGLTQAVRLLLREGGRVGAVRLLAGERRLDIGAWRTYLAAAAEAAIDDSESGPAVRDLLAERIERP
ncbi:MAG: NTP transferase domain-containing protein [Chthonomonadales bacterium]|nr:NTP transferase domain-containing protein [Chthonomonadales bacterium]